MECVGRIEALGPDTEGLKIGERVVAVAVPAIPGPHVAARGRNTLLPIHEGSCRSPII